ncbi:ABC transporter permease subunit [Galbitalea sp. SE-J8]|uniref:ABC transporter permease subunit n=1 Tax=Galbitalea sp. SE-J8 TaxID=3054952 RepID=UPI00259CFBE0|nr:ABC transporter permease subunit [Galbitalea sp. SE-J8]MDM4763403.1 ABC transporter permease subunit [Galbitalea sp. SE-J8]
MSARSGAVAIGAQPGRVARIVILGVVGLAFAVPVLAMVQFTFRAGLAGGLTLSHWTGLVDADAGRTYRSLFQAVGNSGVLVLVTVAIVLVVLLPTMVLVHLRFRRFERVLEIVCIVPITVPAIVLVVGLAPVYGVVVRVLGGSVWTLAFAYGITVLPYAYRAIRSSMDAVDLTTLTEAARTLSAGWPAIMVRVIVPVLRRGILAAAFIAVAVVLGEFTIASLLNRVNLQTALLQVSQSDPYVAVIFALLALALAFVLLLSIGRLGAAPRARAPRARKAPA